MNYLANEASEATFFLRDGLAKSIELSFSVLGTQFRCFTWINVRLSEIRHTNVESLYSWMMELSCVSATFV